MSDPWGDAVDSDPNKGNAEESKSLPKNSHSVQDEENNDSWMNKKYDATSRRSDRRGRGRGYQGDSDRGGHKSHFDEHKDNTRTRDRDHDQRRPHYRRGERGRFPRVRPDQVRDFKHQAERAKIKRHRMFENRHDKQVIFREDDQQIDPENFSTQSHFRSDRDWDELNIPKYLLEAIEEVGYIYPSKIQSFGIDVILQDGYENLIAQAPNGSGKTATFIIGSLSRVDITNKNVQVVCVGHTIELTNQLFQEYQKFTSRVGINLTMVSKDTKPADLGQVIVTLPGSFNKLLKMKCDLSSLKVFVVDEADHLLDSKNSPEFYNTLSHALTTSTIPSNVQFLLFSATFSEDIKTDIVRLLKEMNEINIKKEELMLDLIKHYYIRCEQSQKISTFEQLLKKADKGIAVSFINTCDFALNVLKKVQQAGHRAALLMGKDMTVNERNLTMKDFRDGKYGVLITTNLLARGIDNTKVNCVVNFDLPRLIRSREMDYVLYLHRSGRCSRFGRTGICINLITNDQELQDLMSIQEYYSISINILNSLEEFEKVFNDLFKGNEV